jgi:C-8 sterol isomerase
MAYIFEPDTLHEISRHAAKQGERSAIIHSVSTELKRLYPRHIDLNVPWLFNNAGGAMGQIKLLHCSLSEYILIFGTPSGTEGHSGRYATEVFDFMLDGEMWCFHAGEFERTIFKAGDLAYLGEDRAKGYAAPSDVLMLEYARGPIPTMLPFGLADTLFSTHDPATIGGTLFHYAKLVTRNLLKGKI